MGGVATGIEARQPADGAGAAAAPPATPQIYLEVEDSAQNRLLVPAYNKPA